MELISNGTRHSEGCTCASCRMLRLARQQAKDKHDTHIMLEMVAQGVWG